MRAKRLLISLAVAFATAAACALVSSAADNSHLYIGGSEYDASVDQTGTGWSWSSQTLTLTLNGYNGDRIEYRADIDEEINMVVSGENLITNAFQNGTNCVNAFDAISFDTNNLIINGDGVLKINNPFENADDAISVWSVDDEVTSQIDVSGIELNFLECDYGFYTQDIVLTDCTINFVETPNYGFNCNTINAIGSTITVGGTGCEDDEVYVICLWGKEDSEANFEDCTISVDIVLDYDNGFSLDSEAFCDGDFTFTNSTFDFSIGCGNARADAFSYYFFDIESFDLTFDNCDVTFTNSDGMDSFSYSCIVDYANSVTFKNGTSVVFDSFCDGIGASAIYVTDSEITGEATGYIFIAEDMIVTNSVIDIAAQDTIDYWDTYGFELSSLTITDSEVSLSAQDSAFYDDIELESLSLTDSSFRVENIDGESFVIPSYTFEYTVPEYWGIYIDDVLSEDYTVESTDIASFGQKIFEIRYIHECTFEEWTSDGTETHSATCECGEVKQEPHTWDNGVVTKDPSVGVAGEMTYICTVCGETRVEAIAALVDDGSSSSSVSEEDSSPKTGVKGVLPVAALALVIGCGTVGVILSSKKEK